MTTRRATTEDVAAVTSVYVEAWRAGYEGLLEPAVLVSEAAKRANYDWHRAITQSDRVVLVAEQGDEIVGVVECEHAPRSDRAAEVHMLYVVPSAWGTGAATELVDEALAEARRAGQRTVWLMVVEGQSRARRFYEREGWQHDETIPPASNGLVRLISYRRDLYA